MSAMLDLDDAAAVSPLAVRELRGLRALIHECDKLCSLVETCAAIPADISLMAQLHKVRAMMDAEVECPVPAVGKELSDDEAIDLMAKASWVRLSQPTKDRLNNMLKANGFRTFEEEASLSEQMPPL